MSRQPRPVTREQSASEHAARYEVLRRHVMARQGAIACYGLVVLLRQGVAAWMDVASQVPAPAQRSAKDASRSLQPLPAGSSAEVVRVLAAMTLEHIQQVHL